MEAAEVATLLTIVVFAGLAVASFRQWRARHAAAGGWLALAFALVVVPGVVLALLPDDATGGTAEALRKASFVGLVFFPYSLYRFTAALRPAPRALDLAAGALTGAIVIATVAAPMLQVVDGGERPGWLAAYLIGLAVQWTLLSFYAAARLWTAGRDQPTLTRRRMRSLGLGAIGLSLVIILLPATPSDGLLGVVVPFMALASGVLFFIGFGSPRLLGRLLGERSEESFRDAVAALMGATTAAEAAQALLRHVTELVGGDAATLLDRDGRTVGSYTVPEKGNGPVGAAAESGNGARATAAVDGDHGDRQRVEVPLESGSLVVWTSPYTPVFGRHELVALTSLGRLTELAIERSDLYDRERKAHDALRRQIDFSRMLVDSSVDGILAFDRNYRYTLWNQGMERITGVSRAEVIGRSAFSVFPFLKEIGEDRYFDEALSGREATSTDRRFDIPSTGREGFFESRYAPLHGAEGDVVGGLAVVRDITDRKRMEQERERRQGEELARAEAEARSTMVENLQAVTDTALGHLNLDDMVSQLLDRITELLETDMAVLALLDEDQATLVVRAATGFESQAPSGVRIPVGRGSLGEVAAERRPVAYERLEPAHSVTAVLHEEGIVSVLGVPLLVGGKLIGALQVGSRRERSFSDEDTTWLQLVADRVALAVEHATVYEREHRIAETLQRSLLPEGVPELPGMQIAARYIAGGAGAVGGDWYDVIPLSNGRVGLAMGDVVGHGIGAASLMGQLRSALRAYALDEQDPGRVLTRLDRLMQSIGPGGMATLLYLVVDLDEAVLTFTSAGHLPPLVRDPEGAVRFLDDGGSVPLGVQPRSSFEARRRSIERGSTVILYTDGLIERRDATIDQGMQRLADAVAGAPEAVEDLCDHIVSRLLPDAPSDDTAVLAVQPVAAPSNRMHLTPPAEPRALAPVRTALRRWLTDAGLGFQEVYEVLVASGEACANAIEHAYGPGDATFEVDAAMENGTVWITVRDFGRWRPPRGEQRGRGMQLMQELMDSADVIHGEEGTTVRLGRSLGTGEAVA